MYAFTDRKGTRWRVALLPLGGYVKFHGDINGASQPDTGALAAMPGDTYKQTFAAQPVWKRAATVAAGPVANFVLAIAIFSASYMINGRAVLLPRIEKVETASAAERAGLQAGDVILSFNITEIKNAKQFNELVAKADSKKVVALLVQRGKDTRYITLKPEAAAKK